MKMKIFSLINRNAGAESETTGQTEENVSEREPQASKRKGCP